MMPSRATSLLGAMAIVAALFVGSAAPAYAAPGDGGAVVDSPTLRLSELGSNSTIAFYGQQGTESLTIPVPSGLVPATLNVTKQLPVSVRSATLTVNQDNREIARVEVPPGDRGPLVIPLAGVEIVDNAVTLVLRSYLLPLEGYCLDPTNPLRLTDVTVTYSGVERAPTTVADFLPPILRKLTIYIVSRPSQAEADAAVRLATATVAHYGQQNTAVELVALPDGQQLPPTPSQPLERQIVLREKPETGLSLQGATGVPALLISGPANELTNQTRLLSSDISRIALSSRAVVGPLTSTPQLPGNQTTLRKLGQPGVNATALSPRLQIGLDQTRFGRPVRDVRIHVRGSYTPLPETMGAQLVASVGDDIVDRWPVEANGVLDRWVNVPDRVLQRYTTLDLRVDVTGNTGRCGEFQPITLTVDGETAVESRPAKPPVPQGLQSMPQALMPRVQVGIGPDTFADTARAVSVMTGLQRLSGLPIDTAVVPLQQAIDSPNPAVLISADGWEHSDITLPVSVPRTGSADVDVFDNGKAVTLKLDPAMRFASLQTVFTGGRSLLIATSNAAPGQLDAFLRWLGEDERRWARLSGAAVLAVPDRPPVTVNAPDVTSSGESGRSGSAWIWWVGGGVFAAVVVAAAALIMSRSRRGRPGG
jgi:hypothetical protein